MTDYREEIQAFLAGRPMNIPESPHIRKAGLIPFMPENPRRYCVLTPVASKPDLGLPEFQLCKGTRMYCLGSNEWKDMKGEVPDDAPLEPLAATALREAREELGIELDNILYMEPLGDFTFTSATNRKDITMWMMAAEMSSMDHFLPMADIAKFTSERSWLTLAEFEKLGRPDHAHVLKLIDQQLPD